MFENIKGIFQDSECPDCGWWCACDACSLRFDAVDSELTAKEQYKVNKPVQES